MSGDNNDPVAPPVSKYMAMKAEIEAEEKALLAKKQRAETLRKQEIEEAIYEIRQKIIALGLTPQQLFPSTPIKNLKDLNQLPIATTQPRPGRQARPVKYALNGQTWSGMGKRPGWYKDAIESGQYTEDQLRANVVPTNSH